MANIREVLDNLKAEDGGYTIDVPEAWSQGRTLFGGMSAALAYAATRRACPDLPPLRSAQLAFVGPASGRLRIVPALLRRGRSAASFAVDASAEDVPAVRATFLFGAPRESAVTHDLTPRRAVPPPDACERFHRTSKPLTGFLANIEYRLAAGSRLFEPANAPEFAVWVRLRDGDADDAVTTLLALADALPCAAMASFPKPAAVSTTSWEIDLHHPLAPSGGWHLVTSASEWAAEGYSLQAMRVFNEAGEPLASARQVVAIFA